MNEPSLKSPANIQMAWLQLRMCWQPVKKTRLDQEKKDLLAILIRHYRETGRPDRLRFEFEQVLLRLQEEHELRVREFGRETRRVAKQVNNIIQVICDTNASRLQHCQDMVDETPAIITEWQGVMDLLFSPAGSDPEVK